MPGRNGTPGQLVVKPAADWGPEPESAIAQRITVTACQTGMRRAKTDVAQRMHARNLKCVKVGSAKLHVKDKQKELQHLV